MSEKLQKSWPSLVACADVTIEECGGIKIKAGQCIAFPDTIYRVVRVRYPELGSHPALHKEGTMKEIALAKQVYEIYEPKKAEKKDPPKDPPVDPDKDPKDPPVDGKPTEAVLMKNNREALVATALDLGIEVKDEMVKRDIVALILEKQ